MWPHSMTAFAHTPHLYPTEQLTVSCICHSFHGFIWACYPSSQSTDSTLLLKTLPHYTMTQLMCSLHSFIKFLFFCRHTFALVFCIIPFLAISQGLISLKTSQGPDCFISCSHLFKHSPSPTVGISDSAIIKLCAD